MFSHLSKSSFWRPALYASGLLLVAQSSWGQSTTQATPQAPQPREEGKESVLSTREEYVQWRKFYSHLILKGLEDEPLRLAISQRRIKASPSREDFVLYIFASGDCLYHYYEDASYLGTPQTLTAAQINQLDALIASLPKGKDKLAPNDRRVIVQIYPKAPPAPEGNQENAHEKTNGAPPSEPSNLDGETRLFDRANLPEALLQILRLGMRGAEGTKTIESYVPMFAPLRHWEKPSPLSGLPGRDLYFVSVSPDNRWLIAYDDYIRRLSFLDPDTLAPVVPQLPLPDHTDLALLPFETQDNVTVIRDWDALHIMDNRTWRDWAMLRLPRLSSYYFEKWNSQFTPDRRYFLTQQITPYLFLNEQYIQWPLWASAANDRSIYWSGEWTPAQQEQSLPPVRGQMLAFDTKNGKQAPLPSNLPPSPHAYFGTAHTNQAIYLSNDWNLGLWDYKQRREIKRLDSSVWLGGVGFSPDGKLVATSTTHFQPQPPKGTQDQPRIRLWNAKTGTLVRELWPFERSPYAIGFIGKATFLWTPDGRTLIAAFNDRGISKIGLWDVQSGRQRGQFINCPESVEQLKFLPDGRLLAFDRSAYSVYDLAGALQQINTFQKSLSK